MVLATLGSIWPCARVMSRRSRMIKGMWCGLVIGSVIDVRSSRTRPTRSRHHHHGALHDPARGPPTFPRPQRSERADQTEVDEMNRPGFDGVQPPTFPGRFARHHPVIALADPTIKTAAYADLASPSRTTGKAGPSWSPGLNQVMWLTFVSEDRVRPDVHAQIARDSRPRVSNAAGRVSVDGA